jgi:AraC-like DNA-binding protein
MSVTEGRPESTLPSGRPHIFQALRDPSGEVRVGPLLTLPEILREHGVNLSEVLLKLGLDPQLFDDPEAWLPFRQLGRLLEECATQTKCRYIGLLVGQRFTIDSLGILGQLMSNAPTLRDALRMGSLHLTAHDRGAISLTLDLGEKLSALGYALFEGTLPAADQILDGALAMQLLLLRKLAGPGWKPAVVQLSHRRPQDIGPFRRHFGDKLEFDARVSAIVFESRWLDHPVPGADPKVFGDVLAQIGKHETFHATSFVDQVRRGIYSMSVRGTASASSLARLFNLHERTLRRRLGDEGATFRELLGEIRSELAQHLLRDTDLPVAEVAWFLGYSDPTVFARAFRRWSDASPSDWRAQRGRGA